ncbi:MAG: hypothetical protein D6784_02765 [Chloroflexi bacterium]|nr:MAG: hypothetical protein D6784_02765 [Chloroflexota bacterium]
MLALKNQNRFRRLLNALENGWEIEEPVLIRAPWNLNEETGGVYHFVLRNRREDKTSLFSLPPSPELLQFLATRRITVTAV